LARKKKELEDADKAIYGESTCHLYCLKDVFADNQVISQVSKSDMEPKTLRLVKISS